MSMNDNRPEGAHLGVAPDDMSDRIAVEFGHQSMNRVADMLIEGVHPASLLSVLLTMEGDAIGLLTRPCDEDQALKLAVKQIQRGVEIGRKRREHYAAQGVHFMACEPPGEEHEEPSSVDAEREAALAVTTQQVLSGGMSGKTSIKLDDSIGHQFLADEIDRAVPKILRSCNVLFDGSGTAPALMVTIISNALARCAGIVIGANGGGGRTQASMHQTADEIAPVILGGIIQGKSAQGDTPSANAPTTATPQ